MSDIALSARGITVRFGDVEVLSAIDIDIKKGCIHGLIGENGAGKSTLGKVLGGYYRASAGSLSAFGLEHSGWDTTKALAHGISIMHQELQLVPALTVAQNVYLGMEENHYGILRGGEQKKLGELMQSSGLHLDPNALVQDLTIAEQQKIEILRALARKAQVIVMDEPTSSLSKIEVEQLHRIMKSLRDEGRTVIYVTHFLNDILEVTDKVTVLRNGQLVHTVDTASQTKETLVSAMLGDEKSETLYPPKPKEIGEKVVFSVKKLRAENGAQVDNLEIKAGEIVGLAGLVGSGRSEIARAIVGADKAIAEISINGEVLKSRSIEAATNAGLVLVPEDRRKQGLIMALPVANNISLPHLDNMSNASVVNSKTERSLAKSLIDKFSIRPADTMGDVLNYSGGNQQKVLLGKWLASNPNVVILDEPSRGVDVGARETIHNAIADLAKQGTAILLISSEIEEVLGLATRVYLVDRGRLVEEINPDEADESDVLAALFRHQSQPSEEVVH